eukprot:TRINITY_DN37381_c0_g1_i1.p1 TRINITY_DN37381_c0_g1~~TRINITY_DN37381_c0_g1_i1.p1  ORF type:complete len:289 (-),score=74.29 TRINITY_DN37381_c0_g1_i1:33-875(-)
MSRVKKGGSGDAAYHGAQKYLFKYHPTQVFLVEPDKVGYLTKQGGFPPNWKRRWFVLKDNHLFYFATSSDENPKGVIPLEHTLVQSAEVKDFPFCFVVFHPEFFTYYIAADSQADMSAWMSAIQGAKLKFYVERWTDDRRLRQEAERAKQRLEEEVIVERKRREKLETELREAQDTQQELQTTLSRFTADIEAEQHARRLAEATTGVMEIRLKGMQERADESDLTTDARTTQRLQREAEAARVRLEEDLKAERKARMEAQAMRIRLEAELKELQRASEST